MGKGRGKGTGGGLGFWGLSESFFRVERVVMVMPPPLFYKYNNRRFT